jgi:sugar phosphate isomerase/epimerase
MEVSRMTTTILGGTPLAIQSWCFRNYSNVEIVGLLKDLNVPALEICRKHLDILADVQAADPVLRLYRDNGLILNSYGINSFSNDEAKVRPFFEFAKKAGIRILGCKPDHDAYDLLERLSGEYNIRLAIHNHGSKDQMYGKVEQLREAMAKSSDNIGLCLDTGWLIDAGGDPVEMVREYPNRIYGVHFKDFTYDADGTRHEAVLGDGKLDVAGLLRALKESKFAGYTTIEYEGEPENPIPSIRKCIARLKEADQTL